MAIRYLSGINVDSNTLFVDDVNNRVGIGTASPGSTLDVLGKVSINGDGTLNWGNAKDYGRLTWDTGKAIVRGESGKALSLGANGTQDYLYINTSGNVGIGTTSPNRNLTVSGNGTLLGIQSDTVGGYSEIEMTANGVGGGYIFKNSAAFTAYAGAGSLNIYNSGSIGFHTASVTNAMFIASATGNVGIGTTAPTSPLHISSATNKTITLDYTAGSGSYSWASFRQSGTEQFRIWGSYSDGYLSFYNDQVSAHQFTLASSGNVGIGTTSPAQKLDVSGNIQATTGLILTGNAAKVSTTYSGVTVTNFFTDANGGVISVDGSNRISLRQGGVSGTDAITIAGSGNVGIGTTSPAAKLHLSGAGATELRIASTTGNTNSLLSFYEVALASWGIDAGQANGSFFIKDLYNSATRLTILNSGNVGIGTTSPTTIFAISQASPIVTINSSDASQFHGIEFRNGNTLDAFIKQLPQTSEFRISNGRGASWGGHITFYTDTVERMRIASTGATRLNAYGSGSFTGTVAYNLAVDSSGNIIETAGGVVDGSGTANYVTKWIDGNTVGNSLIYDDGTTITFQTGASERMRITSDGNVAINSTTTSGYRLYVNGSTWINGGTNFQDGVSIFRTESGAAEVMRIASNGNVGIGTTTPANRLQIGSVGSSGFGGNDIVIGNGTQVMAFYQSSTVSTWYTNTNFALMPSGVGATGNVGIGTTSPGAKLHVSGGEIRVDAGQAITLDVSNNMYLVGASNQLRLYNGANPVVNITTAGNVGIGTTSPGSLLHVYGANPTVKIQGTGTASAKIDLVGPYTVWTLENQYINGATNDMFRIYNSELGADAITINRLSNNVGIGTTSPAATLDIVSSGSIQTSILARGLDANFRLVSRQDKSSNDSGAVVGEFGVDWTTTRNSAIRFHRGGDVTGGFMTFTTNDGSERMRITSAGNVGVGTTSPGAKFQVTDASSSITLQNYLDGAAIFLDGVNGDFVGGDYFHILADGNSYLGVGGYAGGATPLNVSNAGNVGIGTTSPSQALHVSGNIRVTGAYYDSNNSAGSSGQVLSSTGSGTDWVSLSEITGVDGTGTANYIAKWSDTDTITNSQVFDNGTNVGINNASPKTKLDVNGAIGFGSKTLNISDTFVTVLTVNMSNHTGCYVKITAFGDWSGHSAVAYLGEFFLQNGASAYNEPGVIIRQVDNTNTDDVVAQIVDPAGTGTRDFEIQLKTTSASGVPFSAAIQYEVRGQYNSVS